MAASRGSTDKVAEFGSIGLSTGRLRGICDSVATDVGVICGLEGGLVTRANGGKDGVSSSNSTLLGRLKFGTRVGTRVKEDKGSLLFSNGGKVTSSNSLLQGSNARSVFHLSLGNYGSRNGTISRGHAWDSQDGGSSGGDLSEGSWLTIAEYFIRHRGFDAFDRRFDTFNHLQHVLFVLIIR
jgi:hypothetical protein